MAAAPILVAIDQFVPRWYPYWSNVWLADATHAYLFAGHVDGVARFYAVNLTTGATTPLPLTLPYRGTTEGWSWNSAGWITLVDGARLLQVNPFSGDERVLLDGTDRFPGCVLWQAHVTDDGRTACATVARVSPQGPYDRLGTIALRDGREYWYPATGWLDESQVTDQWLIIKEERERDGNSRLDNRVINLDTGTDYWLLDEAGAVGHSDADSARLVGEDNYRGVCQLLDFGNVESRVLFPTWNMGHLALRRGTCLQSDHAEGALFRIALDGSGRTFIYHHGVVDTNYDRQVRACLDPTGKVAAWLDPGAGTVSLLPLDSQEAPAMGSPLDQIIAALQHADAQQPTLKDLNTFISCGQLLELTAQIAGPDWAFIGKSTSTGMDGAGFRPAWFTPRQVVCTRPDGQRQSVLIDALSQDALWHTLTQTQYKVIANSTANELPPGDSRRGPAHLTPYEIEPRTDYRWHNPPIAQNGAVAQPPAPVADCAQRFPPQDQVFAFGQALNTKYQTDRHAPLIGLDSENIFVYVNLKGMSIWLADYMRLRVAGQSHEAAQAQVFTAIDAVH